MIHAFLVLAALSSSSPVHVALRPAATVTATADGFVTLGSVADLTGGGASARARLSAVVVARAPLPGAMRRLTRGDLCLKLRQAGCDPDHAAVLEGAAASDLTTAPPAPNSGEARSEERTVGALLAAPSSLAPALTPASPELGAGGAVIHRGDAVTIQIIDGALAITASGTARENGGTGDTIRVHRDGVMTDLTVRVVDAQTVQMEL